MILDGNKNFEEVIEETHIHVIKSLQKFILKIQTSLRLMYAKTINYQCFIEEKDEFINLITKKIFHDDIHYNLIYELYSIRFSNEVKNFKEKLLNYALINPEDLEIRDQFCLNKKTAELKDKMLKRKSKNLNYFYENSKLAVVEEEKDCGSNSINSKKLESVNEKGSLQMDEIEQKNVETNLQNNIKVDNYEPYKDAIKNLYNLEKLKSPMEKLHLLANLSRDITEAVNTVWNNFSQKLSNNLLDINADDLMAIFIYIIMKSQYAEIIIHLNIIKDFTTKITRNTMIGYYYTTIEAAIIYISDLSLNEKKSNISQFLERRTSTNSRINNIVSKVSFDEE